MTRKATRGDVLMMIRKARSELVPGWIVHDFRDPASIKTPPWKRATVPNIAARYPTHKAALAAACRALRNGAPLPEPTT